MADDITQNYLLELLESNGANVLCSNQLRERGVPALDPVAAGFLRALTAAVMPKRILEIGTAEGFSGRVMLEAFDEAVLFSIERDERAFLTAKENFARAGLGARVRLFCGDACEILPLFSGEFDMVFLDGAKGSYCELLQSLEGLLRVDGVLVCDNTLFRGNVQKVTPQYNGTLVRRLRLFLEQIHKPPWVTSVLDIGDGMSISVKKSAGWRDTDLVGSEQSK